MKPLFKNITKYTEKKFNEFTNFHNNKFSFSENVYTVLMSVLLMYCIIFNIKEGNVQSFLLFSALLILFLLFRLYWPYKRFKKIKEEFKKNKPVSIIFSFYKHYFTIGKKTIYYFKLYKVFETNDCFYLYVNEDTAAVVDKKGFNIGTAEDFSNFIKKKCLLKYSREN